MLCKDCKHCQNIGNTDETNQALCTFPMSYFPVDINAECAFAPHPYTCKDCDRFSTDMACMTAEPDDLVEKDGNMCCGFVDIGEAVVMKALFDWGLRGFDVKEKLDNCLRMFNEDFTIPWEAKDNA